VAGDAGFAASATLHKDLVGLDTAIARSDAILGRANDAGIEVGEAKLELDEAHDYLTKARVAIHSVQTPVIEQNIQAGLKVAEKTYQAGVDAMAEGRYRRKGLIVSLFAIALVMIALALLLRAIEGKRRPNTTRAE
jgi:hypothetical protein